MEISEATKQYWKDEDWENLRKASTLADLYTIASRILNQMPQGNIIEVCGPIGTGGRGSVEANLAYFNEKIHALQRDGHIVFDQMPFEDSMQRIKKELPVDAHDLILSEFYLPLLTQGKIAAFYFLPGWETSKGATWEHDLAGRLGIPIHYL
ncbi:MAG: DUF4406 domain-containing protein [Patescibacteria group bacterium]